MRWVVVPEGNSPQVQSKYAQILAVHAALLHTGEILYFTGSQFLERENLNREFNHTRLFDCNTEDIIPVDVPVNMTDLFCCGHAMLPDGRLLVAGGTAIYRIPDGHFGVKWDGEHDTPGIREAWIFDPIQRHWVEAPKMNLGPVHADLMLKRATNLATGGRWYPTLVTMPNGSVLAMGGRPGADDARRTNTTMEVFNGVAWDRIGPDFDDESSAVVQYPRLHAMPGGYVFRSFPPRPAPAADSKTVAFATGQWFCVGAPVPAESYGHSPKRIDERPAGLYREYAGASVLLPLLPEERYRPRVLVCGGRRAFIIDLGDYTPGDASQACDPSSQAIGPSWRTTSARRLRLPNPLTGVPYSPERRGCNAVLLPTGHVFVCGGVEGTYDAGGTFMRHNDDAVLEAEQYDPVSDTWEVLERAHVVRNYHSVSLLMPDGRIWTAGSNENCDQGKSELRIEIYEPWYFGRPDRPEITRVIHRHRNTLSIETPQASSVQRVAMIRAGSVTHAFNSDQRYIGLRFSRGDGVLSAQIPSSDIAIPGYYLLFLIDHSVPSKGTFIHVSPTNFQAPTAGVLFWLLGGTLGVLPSGRGQRVPPGDPPFRDMLLGLAAYELGRHIEDPEERAAVQKVGLNLVSNIAQKTLRAI